MSVEDKRLWQRNPHRAGSKYWKLFNWMQHAGRFTRAQYVDYAMSLGEDYERAYYNVTVMMSPRKESTRGSVLGNTAAAGHLYYVEKLDRRVINGDREAQHYKFRWRTRKLEPLKRKSTVTRKTVGIDSEREVSFERTSVRRKALQDK